MDWSRGRRKVFRKELLIVALAIFFPMLTAAGSKEADIPNQRLEELQEKIDVLQKGLGGLKSRSEKEQKQLRAVEIEIGRLNRGLRRLKAELRKQRNQLQKLEMQKRKIEAKLEKQKGFLERELRTAYMTGRQPYLKLLLNQQEPQKLGRILVYYDYFHRSRAKQIHLLGEHLAELERLSARIGKERSTIARLTEQREKEKKALEKRKQERREVLAALQRKIGKGTAELARLRQDEMELKALIGRLEHEAKRFPVPSPFQHGKDGGRFLWPVEGPITATFGSPRTRELRWKGVLIDAPEGAPVQAIAEGNVIFADWLRGYGLLVIIDHGSGYMSLYGHNQSLQKEVGARVKAGEVISTVGNSGGNVHSGLYFEIRRNGQPVDPARWCVARK